MKKKILIPLVLVILALMAGSVWLFLSLQEQKQVNQDMQELAELDKQEMENEYERLDHPAVDRGTDEDTAVARGTEACESL